MLDTPLQDPNQLFCVRLAQGLLHLGKGTLTLQPQRQGGLFVNPSALAGLISTLYLFTDFANLVINRPYLLFVSTMALQPRYLVTVDEDGKPLQVNVRVGKSVDTVGVAGRPKTLTGFQTFKTPVLLGHAEAAELATEEYVALGMAWRFLLSFCSLMHVLRCA
jgi:26S proteasome regulatory subunit N1